MFLWLFRWFMETTSGKLIVISDRFFFNLSDNDDVSDFHFLPIFENNLYMRHIQRIIFILKFNNG